MQQWIADHEALLASLAAMSVITFIGTLIVIPILVVRIPEDYFTERRRRPVAWWERHRLLRIVALVVKNVLGGLFIAAGVAMLLLPGQGALTIIVGLMLTDFPGKFRLERWLASRRAVVRAMTWIRARAGRPPCKCPAGGTVGTVVSQRPGSNENAEPSP
ncbi:MAG: PGPGW domain-containing protein [Planctomycetota bacterium]|jgi:hypothetical protein